MKKNFLIIITFLNIFSCSQEYNKGKEGNFTFRKYFASYSDTTAKFIKMLFRRSPANLNPVHLLDSNRESDLMRELAIIRQDHQAFTLIVQSSCWLEPLAYIN